MNLPFRYTAMLVLALAGGACGPSRPVSEANAATGAASAAEAPTALSVATIAPDTRRWARSILASGSVAPFEPVEIAAPANGMPFATVRAQVGDQVRAGQVLATMEVAAVRLRRAQTLAEVDEARANLEQADAQLAGSRLLDASGAISRQSLVAAQTGASVSAARLAGARARLAAIDLELRDSTLRAPADGLIASSRASAGSVPAAGSAVFTLIPGGRLEWRAQVGMREIGAVREGQQAVITAPDGSSVIGTVRRVSPLLDPATLTGIVYVDLPASSALKAGGVASGILAGAPAEVSTLPASAIVTRDGFDYAWRVDDTHHVHALKLSTGQRRDGRVEVLAGLPAGARVVERGAGLLDEGDRVAVVEAGAMQRADAR
ncbi:efflux RND transporter periplasmic adaptor subunit [Burkholderia gladioli pv. alliicola]|uniref:efflux RND transporter periplasmic adaptor subunit n=1 Tax=Burkholderia gladioli TaxID=28095 RepID=UPI000BF141A2|nr:efflux RND transporter periplasmic adaptor subunit [Burkholderia gladioli]PEH80685.1 efflux transporter periplasmic adaptor subunit [Burkholderia gladioli]